MTRLQCNIHMQCFHRTIKIKTIDGNMNISVSETQNHELHGRLNV